MPLWCTHNLQKPGHDYYFVPVFCNFTSASLSFTNVPLNVICRLFVTAALTLKLLLCANSPRAYIHVLSCCCRCFLSLCVFLSFSHSVLSLPSDAARCHNAAVTAGAGAITGHTHHGKHTCILYVHSPRTLVPTEASACYELCSDQVTEVCRSDRQHEIRWPFLDSVTDRREREDLKPALSPYVPTSFVPAWWSFSRLFKFKDKLLG